MKTCLAAVALLLAGAWASAQSLAELAQKEKERRAAKAREAKPGEGAPRVITQEDLDQAKAERGSGEGTASSSAPPAVEAAEAEPARTSGGRSPMGMPDDSAERARLEKSWRRRAEGARTAVVTAEREVDRAQTDRNALGTGPQVSGRNPLPGGPRILGGENPAEWTKKANAADARLNAAKARLEAAKQSLESFEEEARRAGIPPGWVR
jgi:hypothetical protein